MHEKLTMQMVAFVPQVISGSRGGDAGWLIFRRFVVEGVDQ